MIFLSLSDMEPAAYYKYNRNAFVAEIKEQYDRERQEKPYLLNLCCCAQKWARCLCHYLT